MIRSICFFIGFIIATVIHSSLSLLLFWLPFRLRYQFIILWSRFLLFWLRVTCGLSYQVHGIENLPQTPCIVLCNHQSTWETFALQIVLPIHATVLKKELLNIPFFGWGLRLLDPIAIDRKQRTSAIHQLINQGQQRLQQQRWVVIFPEGTRHPFDAPGKFGPGGALLAQKTAYPVVPIAHNAGKYWPRHSLLKKPGTIQMMIGAPIISQGKSAREINELAQSWIQTQQHAIESSTQATNT